MPVSKPNVAVIIPYYQVEKGLLARAVTSVFRQDINRIGKVLVVVIDDGSPSNWREEGLPDAPAGFELRIVEKPNGGVSSARNAGLDAVDPGFDYIAFLDSDDSWFEEHLDQAVSALDQGDDLYFSDCYDREQVRYFSFTNNSRLAAIEDGQSIAIDGADLFDTFLRDCFVHMSFSVFRRDIASDLRFNEQLKLTCEDQIFFLHLARRVRRAIIAKRATGERGFGVSIYRASLDWNSSTRLPRIENQIVAADYLIGRFTLRGDQRQRMLAARQACVDTLVFFGMRDLRFGKGSVLVQLARIFARHPAIVLGLPKAAARLITGSTRKRMLRI